MLKNCLFPWFVYFETSARIFLEGKGLVNCVRETAELVQVVVRGISRRRLQASRNGTVWIYAEQFLQTPRSELCMKINFFNESHSLWGEIVLVTA